MIKLRSTGRGTGYSRLRGLVESTLALAYPGDWPARAWSAWPRADRVAVRTFTVARRAAVARGAPGAPAALRLGFVSDLHIGPTTPASVLDAAFDALAAADLDVLLLGGDYVFLEATPAKAERLRALVARVRPRVGTIAVLGNHDLWTEHALVEAALAEAGARVVVNGAVRLDAAHDDVAILCLDDPWTGRPDLGPALEAAGDATTRIGLCHSPDALPSMQRAGVALFACGHTHGGQIATPWGPVIVPGRVGKRYPHGLHDAAGTTLFVSRGVGATELPMRTWARPDVALFVLE